MSLTINPLLIDKTADTAPARNFARAEPSVTGPAFAEQLAAVEAQNKPKAAPEPPASAPEDTEGTDSIFPSLSWRIDPDASHVSESEDDFGFDDFLDMFNPLHHIPIVGSIYRELTGDEIKPVSRIAGGLMFGALTGSVLVSSIVAVAGAAYEQQAGEDPLIMVADALFGSSKTETAPETLLAQAETETQPSPTPPSGSQEVKVAAAPAVAATAAPVLPAQTKQAFGGVMEPSAARNQHTATRVAAADVMPSTAATGTRIGNTIYTSPLMSNAARVSTLKTAKAATAKQNAANVMAQATDLPSPANMLQDEKSLGAVMHSSADAKAAGSDLPPDLVRDMMLMALDKYKTAENLAPSEMTINATN